MKNFNVKYFLLLPIIQIISIKAVFGQKNELDSVAKSISAGVFERKITLGYIGSINENDHATRKRFEKADTTIQKIYTPKDVDTFVFMRFENPKKIPAFEVTNKSITNEFVSDSIYVGNVFFSERYFQTDYFLTNSNNFEGFYFLYKLYSYKGRVFVNVYPDYTTNVCKRKVHGANPKFPFYYKNEKFCTDLKTHYNKLVAFARINDFSYKDFNNINSSDIKLNSVNSINYLKYFKCFEVINNKELVLQYTKYSRSIDRIDNSKYTFTNIIKKDTLIENTKNSVVIVDNNQKTDYPFDETVPEINENIAKTIIEVVDTKYSKTEQISNAETKIGWIYAGKVFNKNDEIIWVGNNRLIEPKNKISKSNLLGLNAKTLDNIYLRKIAPQPTEGKYKKGSIIGVIKANTNINVLSYKLIPSIDGNQLLWINIQY